MKDKKEIFEEVSQSLAAFDLPVRLCDTSRPWGGFFVIDEREANEFALRYFNLDASQLDISGKLSPKILIVAPGKRLSWQYHHRRAEVWKVLKGKVGVIRSLTDDEGVCKTYGPDEMVTLEQGERHRLVGLDDWGVLAEIWQHTDKDNPSDENDIARLQDDYGRAN